MSTEIIDQTEKTEELIIKLLKKMERGGKNIQAVLWKLMDYFENEEVDEKNDENKININPNTVSLLHDKNATYVCKVGHKIAARTDKHLSIEACTTCGHKNNDNKQNKIKPNNQQISEFIAQYNTRRIPFGPHKRQQNDCDVWISRGWDTKWPLHVAAMTGDIVKIKQLCKNKNMNVNQKLSDWDDALPITIAGRWGQLEALIELIKHSANPIAPPDKGNETAYRSAIVNKHKAIVIFYKQYIKYLYNFDINEVTNLQCHFCYNYDLHFNQHITNETMANYVYCKKCTLENVKSIKIKQENNEIIERRIIKTIQDNPSISVDTLCQMKDVKSLHSILKEIIVSGNKHLYTLWLLDIDNFKSINTYLTHAIADRKLEALAQILKALESKTRTQWRNSGYDGIEKVQAFRQGGDEFAMIICGAVQRINRLQKLYEQLKNNINKITVENMPSMTHITVSIGVCVGQAMNTYEAMMKQADLASEVVKNDGKDGIAIYYGQDQKIYSNFNDIPV